VRPATGFSLVEGLVVLTLAALLAATTVPLALDRCNEARAASAARFLATTFQALRWKAVSTGTAHGLFFERDATGWKWSLVRDGNGNGLRTAEVRNGTDPVLEGPLRLESIVERMTLGFPGAGPFPRIPPSTGNIAALADPVKFGGSDLVSFGPLGTASSGTLYLTDTRSELYGVLLYGPTARVRVWRYVARNGTWQL